MGERVCVSQRLTTVIPIIAILLAPEYLIWVALQLPPVQCCLQTVKSANSQGVRTNCAFQHWVGEGGCVWANNLWQWLQIVLVQPSLSGLVCCFIFFLRLRKSCQNFNWNYSRWSVGRNSCSRFVWVFSLFIRESRKPSVWSDVVDLKSNYPIYLPNLDNSR